MDPQERYEIKRKLGQGGLGAVFEGYDHQLQRKVAIKRLLTEGKNSQEEVDDLMRECHSLSALNSPNIVSLFDIGQDETGPFVVMELLEGETMEELISRAPLIENDFIDVAEQCLEGLLAAHDAHLLHRDLKPCNMMITWLPSGRMQLKLLDFGLAKFATEPSLQTTSHGDSLFGSIYFMAPEQFEQKPLDARTDLYSLGSVFYYSLTAEYPFNGESVAQVMAAHLQGHCKDLREYREDLPEALCNWVMRLMSRDPDQRPASCEEALKQLQGVRQGTFQPAAPEGVQMITHPVRLKAAPAVQQSVALTTETMLVQVPGTAPVQVTTQPVLISNQPGNNHKWIWFLMPILILVLTYLIWPKDNKKPQDAPEPTVTQSPTTAPPSIAVEELIAVEEKTPWEKLRLPGSPQELMKERDKSKDQQLRIKEFIDVESPAIRQRLGKKFGKIDLNKNGTLSLSELQKFYEKR